MKFDGLDPRLCEDIKEIVAPEKGLISFRTFEKQTHEQDATSPQGYTPSDVSRLPSYGTFMETEDVMVEVAKFPCPRKQGIYWTGPQAPTLTPECQRAT